MPSDFMLFFPACLEFIHIRRPPDRYQSPLQSTLPTNGNVRDNNNYDVCLVDMKMIQSTIRKPLHVDLPLGVLIAICMSL